MTSMKRILISASALALCFAAQTASASAVSIHPDSFDECGTNGDGAYNCMYISGGGNMATEVRGWSEPGNWFKGTSVHEEVTFPDGAVLCNSDTITVTNATEVVGCQLSPGGSFPIPTGTYCATLWYYTVEISPITGTDEWVYKDGAQNCGTVSD